MRTVTAIVVNYNGAQFLPEALDSLLRQTRRPEEIIVVDNASTDGSASLIRSRYPSVILIEAPQNLGFAEGNNLAVQRATGDYLALLNSDAVAEERWIEDLVATLEREPRAAVAEGKIYYAAPRDRIDQAGALFNNLGNYWGRGHKETDDRGAFDEPAEVAGVTACAMVVRRAALADAPLFDGSLFMYGEELDLTLRLRSAGWSVLFSPRAVVWHGGMQSLIRASDQPSLFQQFHANRNRLKIIARYYPLWLLVANLPFILLGVLYWDLVFLMRGGPRFFVRAVGQQLAFIGRGFAARKRTVGKDARGWLPWMTRHSLRGLLAQKRRMEA
ncbi:MAG TPA: glycosyltransferase family 2 protein [Thermoanaerobaculia bacterium]|nr:glycosyltransferase family 2 protein [Thermoanaerobaculia bacterium]